jgi:selenoprotein W-related protein
LTTEILSERPLEIYIGSWNLIPSKGGLFEVTVNGDLIFSKKALGRHANPGEIRELIKEKLKQVRAAGRPDSERRL